MVIVDPDVVDEYNPVRQSYPILAIGESKANALSRQLSDLGVRLVEPVVCAIEDEATMMRLLRRHPIKAALVTTGTAADYAIAPRCERVALRTWWDDAIRAAGSGNQLW